MKLEPLVGVDEGDILFSESAWLMVKVTRGEDVGLNFKFHVLNGDWEGEVKEGCIFVCRDNTELGVSDFQRVLSVTKEEFGNWYMKYGGRSARSLIKEYL